MLQLPASSWQGFASPVESEDCTMSIWAHPVAHAVAHDMAHTEGAISIKIMNKAMWRRDFMRQVKHPYLSNTRLALSPR